MNLNSVEVNRLTDDPQLDQMAVWSPNGQHFAPMSRCAWPE